ncbi:histidine kinase [Cupriavidus basilensis]
MRLARRPALILVDELAHSTRPAAVTPSAGQDIEELLSAGIDVWTTVNVQHLDSLNEAVGGITGIRVWETVPDTVFDDADEVILVDLPADELLRRLRDGKVYLPEQARTAASNFFRKGNLIALRELALRRTADRVDDDVRAYRHAESIRSVSRARAKRCWPASAPATMRRRWSRARAGWPGSLRLRLACGDGGHAAAGAVRRAGAREHRGGDAAGRGARRAHRDPGRQRYRAGGGGLCAAPQPHQGRGRARARNLARRWRQLAGRARGRCWRWACRRSWVRAPGCSGAIALPICWRWAARRST